MHPTWGVFMMVLLLGFSAAQVTYDATCSENLLKIKMKLSNNESTVFVENFKGFQGCTPKTVEGKTTINLPLDTIHKCGTTRMTNKYTGQTLYYNRIIIDPPGKSREVLFVKCVLPYDKTKPVSWEKRMRRNVLPVGFVEAEDLNITHIVAYAPEPIVRLSLRQNGKFLEGNAVVQPGTPLEMIAYLDEKSASVYGIMASYLKVTDGTPQHDEVIVMNGCSIDPYIFGNFETTDGGKSLYSKFRAFKFPESNYVLFVGTVNICLKQCRGVQCGNDHLGYGRRKREIPAELPYDPNKLYAVEMTTTLVVRFAPDHFEPVRQHVIGTYDGELEHFHSNDVNYQQVGNSASSTVLSHAFVLLMVLVVIFVRLH